MQRRIFDYALVSVVIFVPLDAHAYLDPGTGSLILQGLLGAIVAAGVVLRLYWYKILDILGIRKTPKKSDSDEELEERDVTVQPPPRNVGKE